MLYENELIQTNGLCLMKYPPARSLICRDRLCKHTRSCFVQNYMQARHGCFFLFFYYYLKNAALPVGSYLLCTVNAATCFRFPLEFKITINKLKNGRIHT